MPPYLLKRKSVRYVTHEQIKTVPLDHFTRLELKVRHTCAAGSF